MQLLSAYGGDLWQPRLHTMREELGTLWGACGLNSEWAPLWAVLLHRPGVELSASVDANAVQMLAPLDIARAQEQHDGLAAAYRAAGVRVVYTEPPTAPTPNQMFMADLFAMTPEGAILARPASAVRAGEERFAAVRLAALGVPIIRSVSGDATFEGADMLWLAPRLSCSGAGCAPTTPGRRKSAPSCTRWA